MTLRIIAYDGRIKKTIVEDNIVIGLNPDGTIGISIYNEEFNSFEEFTLEEGDRIHLEN